MRVLAAMLVIAFVGVCIFVVYKEHGRDVFEDRCAARGGVAVKSHLGPIVCIDKAALIKIPR